MSPRNYREEIETALAGGAPEYVPFTAYEGHLPPSPHREALQAMGLAVCGRKGVCREVTPNVNLQVINEPDGAVRAVLRTPLGEVSKLSRLAAYNSHAPVEHYIKNKDDFRVVEFIVRDRRYEPTYDEFVAYRRGIGDTGVVLCGSAYSPLLELQLVWLGQEQFCYQMADNPDAVLSLYEAVRKSHQPMYDLIAASPAEYVNYCGNLVPVMIGLPNLRRYVLPCWKAFAGQLHAAGKKIGSHLDADNLLILDLIREAGLDYVEAFTPPPDCNVPVDLARREWPGRALWINFPSSQHLAPDERIREVTRDILRQAGDRRGVLFGITENVPEEHMVRSYTAILRALGEFHAGAR